MENKHINEELEYFHNKLMETMGNGLPKKYLETSDLGEVDKKYEHKFKERMLSKDFVNYDIALEMKQLGFDEPCFGLFVSMNNELLIKEMPNQQESEQYFGGILAPTFSQAFRFFREKYQLVHEISWSKYKGGLNFDYDIFSLVLPTDDELGDENDIQPDKSMETYDSLVDKGFRWHESDTYEQAEQSCLIKLIEIVKEKKI